ncbi:hypothetical protein K469DRAFT_395738 [Zopfia rhizophila CBS 207.26]|uniref:Uncharacterized protein n=1 Tax=Zopfia rhizophila CBS 207.26 TaxID=1314779 RepID=A0A6A6DH20_9PEZI|nr:hypothetical protein K469DRAFT_395738 [Zopfia rhizophila CBS 207.26]
MPEFVPRWLGSLLKITGLDSLILRWLSSRLLIRRSAIMAQTLRHKTSKSSLGDRERAFGDDSLEWRFQSYFETRHPAHPVSALKAHYAFEPESVKYQGFKSQYEADEEDPKVQTMIVEELSAGDILCCMDEVLRAYELRRTHIVSSTKHPKEVP